MSLRRPRLKLQPNVVSRPAAPREPEPAAVPAAAAAVPAAAAAATTADPTPAVEPAAKPRPQLPARFKRLAPRLDLSRPSVGAASAADRPGGSTVVPPGGATAADAPASRPSATPTPASAPVTPTVGDAPSAAAADPAPAGKRARQDSGPHPATIPTAPGQAPAPATIPTTPGQAPATRPPPTGTDRPPERSGRSGTSGGSPIPDLEAGEIRPASPPPPPPPAQRPTSPTLSVMKRRDPDSDPDDDPGDDPGSDVDDPGGTPEGMSEEELYLRKRFKVPARAVGSTRREILAQITDRVSENLPIRNKMTMGDLIYWNPATEAMSNSSQRLPRERKPRARRDSGCSVVSGVAESVLDDPVSDQTPAATDSEEKPLAAAVAAAEAEEDEEEEEDEPAPVPQLKVAPDGSIIVDEQSLVVKTNQQKQRDQEMDTTIMCDVNGSRLSFNGYRQRRQINEWSIKETARFYKALSTVGTDFSIMQQLFPNRSRVDLKKKFKKEERCRPHLIERALRQDMQYDLTVFDNDVWEKSVEKCKTAKQMEREQQVAAKKTARAKDVAARQEERAARRPSRRRIKLETGENVAITKTEAADILNSLRSGGAPPAPARAPAAAAAAGASTVCLPASTVVGLPSGAVLPDMLQPYSLPPGMLQLPPGVSPQNLLIIAAPSPDRPEGQVLHVYMIQPGPGQATPDVNVTIPHGLPLLPAPQQSVPGQANQPPPPPPQQEVEEMKHVPGPVRRETPPETGAGDQPVSTGSGAVRRETPPETGAGDQPVSASSGVTGSSQIVVTDSGDHQAAGESDPLAAVAAEDTQLESGTGGEGAESGAGAGGEGAESGGASEAHLPEPEAAEKSLDGRGGPPDGGGAALRGSQNTRTDGTGGGGSPAPGNQGPSIAEPEGRSVADGEDDGGSVPDGDEDPHALA